MYGILIVDDNSLVRMSLVNLISWKQHNATLVAIAHDGNEAFRLCEERLPHIVITDIKMPGCDGITLMQKIHRYYPMIQVIAISAHGVFEYAKQAMQAGCLNYILKPISGEELNESIASAIAVIQSRGGRTDEDLYNLYEYALNSYLSSTEKYCAVFLAGWELPTTEEIESICATKYSGQILKAPTQYFQTFLLIFEKNDVLDNLKKITNALVARDGCRYVIEPIPEAVLIDEVGSYFVGIKKKVALTAFWAGNLVVHDERFILEKLEDEVKIYWSLIDYQGMANALMKRLDRSDIRDFSAMRKNKKLIEDYLRLLMTICLSRFDEVCELMYTDLPCFRFWFHPQTPQSARYTLYPPASLHIERTNPRTLPTGYGCSEILLWCSDPALSDPPASSGIPYSPCTDPLFYGWNIRPSCRRTPEL